MADLPRYTKLPLTFEGQAELLLDMGLKAEKDNLISKLSAVNFTRLKEYWRPFIKSTSDKKILFNPNTDFKMIWDRYRFDRKLRLVVFDAIERIEIAIRTLLVEAHSVEFQDGFAYTNITNIMNLEDDSDIYNKFQRALSVYKNIKRINDEDLDSTNFKDRYSNEYPPFWVACEQMDFGNTCSLFKGVKRNISKKVFSRFNVTRKIMKEWLNSIRIARNICAHHSRLWNRTFTCTFIRPKEKYNPEWYVGIIIPENRKLFPILSVLAYMLKIIIPESRWRDRVKSLLKEFPDIPKGAMGFPDNWEESQIWR